jgi:hypothetical protein
MPITAIALLRVDPAALQQKSLRVKQLDDAVLLFTKADFATEPEQLSQLVRTQVGDAYRPEREDPRGVFFIPDVAPPRARTYEGVIEEIGEGGVWGPSLAKAALSPLAAAGAAGGIGALLGGMLEQLPDSVWQSMNDAARGEPGAFAAASAQLQAAMANSNELSDLASQLAGGLDPKLAEAGSEADLANMLQGSGLDLQKLMGQVEAALASDPKKAAELAEQFFGGLGPDADDQDDEDEPPAKG